MNITLQSLSAQLSDRLTIERTVATDLLVDQIILTDTMTGTFTDPEDIGSDAAAGLVNAADRAYDLAGTIAVGQATIEGTITIVPNAGRS